MDVDPSRIHWSLLSWVCVLYAICFDQNRGHLDDLVANLVRMSLANWRRRNESIFRRKKRERKKEIVVDYRNFRQRSTGQRSLIVSKSVQILLDSSEDCSEYQM